MDTDDLIKVISSMPEAKAISSEPGYWNDVIPPALNLVIDDLLTAHDWDFTTKEYTSEVSLAETRDYIIRGDSKFDCRDVVAVWFDDGVDKLAKYRQDDMDDVFANDQAPSSVFGWTQSERSDDGYPIITLYDTPDAGKEIRVRYLRKGITLKDFPTGFAYTIALGVLDWLFPGRRDKYSIAKKKIIKDYRRGGKDLQRTPISNKATTANNEIASLYGSG